MLAPYSPSWHDPISGTVQGLNVHCCLKMTVRPRNNRVLAAHHSLLSQQESIPATRWIWFFPPPSPLPTNLLQDKYLLLEAIGQSMWEHSSDLLQWDAVVTPLVLLSVVGLGRENANCNTWESPRSLFWVQENQTGREHSKQVST